MKVAEPVRLRKAGFVANITALAQTKILGMAPVAMHARIKASQPNGQLQPASLHYADAAFSCLKLEIGAAGYKTAVELAARILQDGSIAENEFSETTVTAVDVNGAPR